MIGLELTFSIENDKTVEHGDVLQRTPEKSGKDNTMFSLGCVTIRNF